MPGAGRCAAPRGSGNAPSSLVPSVRQVIQHGGGERLPDAHRPFMKHALGSDMSGVRIRNGPDAARAAEDLYARAFTVGQDVYLGAGQYEPGTKRGTRLLAHELTHTVQQTGAAGSRVNTPMSSTADPLEREAEAVAERASSSGHPAASSQQTLRPRLTSPPTVQGAWYDFIVEAGEAAWAVVVVRARCLEP